MKNRAGFSAAGRQQNCGQRGHGVTAGITGTLLVLFAQLPPTRVVPAYRHYRSVDRIKNVDSLIDVDRLEY